jgi:predicted dehydrogenase
MKTLKIGILGYASIAKKAIIPAIIESANFKLHGVASRNRKNENEITKELECYFYNDYESIVKDATIDALYIPLPNSLHFEWAKKALSHGKHLLVEKSLSCTLEEVEVLNKLAENRDLALVENFQFRMHPQLETIKEILISRQIGEIRAVKSSFGFPAFSDENNIRYQKKLGGGALLDAGAYPIKLAQELFGLDLEVTAAALNNEGSEVDIWGAGMLQDKSSSNFMQFSFGFDQFYQCSLEVWGSQGKLFTNRIFTAPPGYQPTILIENREGLKTLHLDSANHYVSMLDYFYRCSQNKGLRIVEYMDNINQARLIKDFLSKAHIKK